MGSALLSLPSLLDRPCYTTGTVYGHHQPDASSQVEGGQRAYARRAICRCCSNDRRRRGQGVEQASPQNIRLLRALAAVGMESHVCANSRVREGESGGFLVGPMRDFSGGAGWYSLLAVALSAEYSPSSRTACGGDGAPSLWQQSRTRKRILWSSGGMRAIAFWV